MRQAIDLANILQAVILAIIAYGLYYFAHTF